MEKELQWDSNAIKPSRPACTFLVPQDLEPFLRRQRDRHRWVIAYLQFLLGKAALYRAQGRLPNVQRVTRKYQADDPTIQRWHVRVPGELWTELRCLAAGCGVTMCNMFVILVRLDQQDEVRPKTNVGAWSSLYGKSIDFFEKVSLEDGITRRRTFFRVSSDPPRTAIRADGPLKGRSGP
ncbi:MAG: DUF1564 family protein [Spirochaetales bacterium]|nr:DUF1564 family protein [Leptospiraceae bacterium]MCP5481882.1 DUF1564 family protein [Spirochaetales bacterium]MCP5486311.1 DUF1564 family protein [Spirochaetales bacterium]